MPHAAGLWYEWHGPEEAEPLILSAGLGGSGSYWRPNVEGLARSHRLLVYDHRGTGRSDRALPETVTVDDFADDILALMDELGVGSASIVGHAAGGVAGLALALKAPARVQHLIVVNGWAAPDPHFLRCFEARLALLEHGGPEAYLRAQPIFLYPAHWASEHSAELDAELPAQLADFQGVENLRKRIAALCAFDISSRLADIAALVWVVVALDDLLVPWTAGELIAKGVPNSGYAPSFGGHALNVTDPDRFNETVLRLLTVEDTRRE